MHESLRYAEGVLANFSVSGNQGLSSLRVTKAARGLANWAGQRQRKALRTLQGKGRHDF